MDFIIKFFLLYWLGKLYLPIVTVFGKQKQERKKKLFENFWDSKKGHTHRANIDIDTFDLDLLFI